MKKLLPLLDVIFISTFACYAFASNHQQIRLPDGLQLITKTQHEENKNPNYKLDAKFPQLKAATLDPAAQQFNQQMTDIVTTHFADFKKNITPPPPTLPKSMNQNTLHMTYTASSITANKNTLISVLFNAETYNAGQAHPVHRLEAVNYDLTSGKALTLDDLFKSNSNYLQIISSYCHKALKKKGQNNDEDWLSKGTAPKAENYRHWTLKPNGVLFTFDEYQVAAYVYGQPKILVPYKELAKVISDSSPIAMCLKKSACK